MSVHEGESSVYAGLRPQGLHQQLLRGKRLSAGQCGERLATVAAQKTRRAVRGAVLDDVLTLAVGAAALLRHTVRHQPGHTVHVPAQDLNGAIGHYKMYREDGQK